ncbi:MAG: vWA domain-containing protein, partial [Aureliella sp.]
FFGSYAQGERFVFVLDSSKSMTGDRWTYACQELMDSVKALEPHQLFFVICFDDKTTCMFNIPGTRTKFYANDEATVSRLKRWLLTRRLGPATFPATAMMLALKMHPDAIFLLSDGEIRDDTLWKLRTVNGFSSEHPQVPIHTIHLMSLEGRATLQLIATENAGTFTPVLGGGGF